MYRKRIFPLFQYKNDYANAAFGYKIPKQKDENDAGCTYYGGFIGEIMGGDNIIDNSYVSYKYQEAVTTGEGDDAVTTMEDRNATVTLKGSNGTIVPVGGYVGVVVFGGLIFKNMDARKTTISITGLNVIYTGKTENLADNDKQEDWAAIYVNPIVGRVINGYAVNETGGNALNADGEKVHQFSVTEDGKYHDENRTSGRNGNQHTLKNGAKHYSVADIDPSLGKLNVANIPVDTTNDGTINVPNSQAMFILSLITQSTSGTAQTADGAYQNSLSYGINNSNVYGMSHNADYTNVGSAIVNTDNDYVAASDDTAANTAVPYIIRHYTGFMNDELTNEIIDLAKDAELTNDKISLLDGHEFYIINSYSNKTDYLTSTIIPGVSGSLDQPTRLQDSTTKSDAATWLFEKLENENKYYISTFVGGTQMYMKMSQHSGNNSNLTLVENVSEASKFDLTNIDTNKYIFHSDYGRIDNWNGGVDKLDGFAAYKDTGSGNNRKLTLISVSDIKHNETTLITGYPARCVTSTKGYYDINLTGSNYVLPDSFRGIGSVGNWDGQSESNEQEYNTPGYVDRHLNPYCMKIDVLNGNGCYIDEDIYLNKFLNDNYFNRLHKGNAAGQSVQDNTFEFSANTNIQTHGIALFDSVVMKSADSKFSDFTLTGSVNTETYKNDYDSSEQQITGTSNSMGQYSWLCTGGVCGWATDGTHCNFEKIDLNNLMLRGSGSVGGLLANSGNRSTTIFITVDRCNATNISLSLPNVWWDNDGKNSKRNTIGAFVGKVKEGGVKIYGAGKSNTSKDNYATVSLKAFSHYDSNAVIPGGVVGYAGNGLEAYDIRLMPVSDSTNITIGSDNVLMAGGFVGLMQPAKDGNSSCVANFIRCEVQHINVRAQTYAGGFYGGTWNSGWSPYSIKVDQCKVTGKEGTTITNTIQAKNNVGGVIADGFVVDASSPNVIVSNTIVSNYNINTTDNNSSSGGFIGYMGCQKGAAVCYVHDSAIENCRIAQSGKYGGGIIGNAQNKAGHKLLGYNLKMDQVTSTSTKMGAWVGKIDNTNITIQFTSLAIYGNGFSQNVGNNMLPQNASFVYADYDGKCSIMTDNAEELAQEGTSKVPENKATYNDASDVLMPKYPYVNVNPQSSMGTKAATADDPLAEGEKAAKVISGDGAVLRSTASSAVGYSGKTAVKTMALKLYEELSNTSNSRRYTTFSDSDVYDSHKIDYYMKRTTEDDGDRISTYATEKGIIPNGWQDFACVVIANTQDDETTALINRYIQLVTNTTDDYAVDTDYHKISISQCELTNGYFKQTSASPGIKHEAKSATDSTMQFKLDQTNADSKNKNTFTLIDVQFNDPLNKENVAYHLYVPVYTIKQIQYDFSASVMTDSDSAVVNSNAYVSLFGKTNNLHLDTFNSWTTTYLRYSYSAEDLNTLINAGKINWNHEKSVILDLQDDDYDIRLPDNTYMVLVDPNLDNDQNYYASNLSAFTKSKGGKLGNSSSLNAYKQDITLELNKFSKNNVNFTPATFNELIASNITATYKSDHSGFYQSINGEPPENDGKTYVFVDDNGTRRYYEYKADGSGNYDLSVDKVLNEDYYILTYAPKTVINDVEIEDYYVYNYAVDAPAVLTAPANILGAKSAAVNVKQQYKILIGELFEQETTQLTVTRDDQQITASNHAINVYTTTKFWLKNTEMAIKLGSTDQGVYHALKINLDRYDEHGAVTNDIQGLDKQRITAWYRTDAEIPVDDDAVQNVGTVATNIDLQESYITVQTAGNIKDSLKTSSANSPFAIYARVKMNFDENKIEDEFPQKKGNAGVNVRMSSQLAYDEDKLSTSSMTLNYAKDRHMYYIESVDSASLFYTAMSELDEYDETGRMSENHSRLGINGRTSEGDGTSDNNTLMPVTSNAIYNAQALGSITGDAQYLHLKFSLQRKTNTVENGVIIGAEYVPVKLTDYLGSNVWFTTYKTVKTTVEGEEIVEKVKLFNSSGSVSSNGMYVEVDIPKDKWDMVDDIYSVDIAFKVKTGEGMVDYANYKVDLQAELRKDLNTNIDGSEASDHLVYTNAKINHEFLRTGS